MGTTFTASEIASSLGVKRQSIQSRLEQVPESGTRIVGGVPARTWDLGSMPESLHERLAEAAQEGGYRDPVHLLSAPPKIWKPAVPLAECSDECLARAENLRDALATAIERRNDPSLSAAELQHVGIADYVRIFRKPISPRHWHDLFQRTIERAGAAPDFSRLEIYLDERPARITKVVVPELQPDGLFELRLALNQCRNVANPSEDAQQEILAKALEAYDALAELGQSPKAIKTQIFGLLIGSGVRLASSRNALRMKFERAYQKWVEADRSVSALEDGRKVDAKLRRQAIPEEDRMAILALTIIDCGGRLSQGWRRALELDALSAGFVARFLHNPSTKSYVPGVVRRALAPKIPSLLKYHHGPRGARDNGAYVDRCWDLVRAGDWYCMDDATLPVYFYVPDRDWFTLMRGQFLLAIDTRSTCILDFALMPERNYNARVIRSLITRVGNKYGLPRRGFYFERGIWENSKILKGETSDDLPIEWLEVDKGLREFGLEFRHAIRARSKPVERVIGALQNLMEGDRGYAGRDEVSDGFERLKDQMLQVQRRKLDPRPLFYSKEQWKQRLEQLCERYNAEVQEGKMTRGLSPLEAFQQFKGPDRRVCFDARCRYLLAHSKHVVKVTTNGISLFGGKFKYKGGELVNHTGEVVIAWFNPDDWKELAVTDMKRENPFAVPLAPESPALDATKEELAAAMRPVQEHNDAIETLYSDIRGIADEFRTNIVSAQTVELGQRIEAAKKKVRKEQGQQARARRAGLGPNVPLHRIEAQEKLLALFDKKENEKS